MKQVTHWAVALCNWNKALFVLLAMLSNNAFFLHIINILGSRKNCETFLISLVSFCLVLLWICRKLWEKWQHRNKQAFKSALSTRGFMIKLVPMYAENSSPVNTAENKMFWPGWGTYFTRSFANWTEHKKCMAFRKTQEGKQTYKKSSLSERKQYTVLLIYVFNTFIHKLYHIESLRNHKKGTILIDA